jgi:signal transduction histidine kinase
LRVFLDLGQIDAGIVKPDTTVFSVADLLAERRREFHPQARQRGLDLHVVPCSAVIRSDKAMLRRIIEKFLANALIFTEEGCVLAGCRRRGERLRIEVRDSGPGIPEERRNSVFDEFVQFTAPDQPGGEGFNVGLSDVKNLAKLMRHKVALRSIPGKGSIFAVTELIRSVHELAGSEIPAILVTGDTTSESVHEMETSRCAVLFKPIEVEELVAHMNRLLGA